ncbi:MAG TPA: DedA family protein [Phenylobacterium sp.]
MDNPLLAIITLGGLLGVAALMFLESVFPPVPSELVMPLAGFLAARGEFGLLPATAAGAAGAMAGAVFWYAVGRGLGGRRLEQWTDRHGHWIAVSPEDVQKSSSFFQRHGRAATFLGRLVPGLRTWISLPAGVARMPIPAFLLCSSCGTVLWTFALAYAGYRLQASYVRVAIWVGPLSWVVLGVCLTAYAYRIYYLRSTRAERR